MSRAGTRVLAAQYYLPPDERERRAEAKRREAIVNRLTPDWFTTNEKLCLPVGMRVAVIGAGFSGVAAAWYLNACGVRTTLYEASETVGGRVRTDRSFVPGKIVEAGAELIGENHPLWGILRSRLSLEFKKLTEDEVYEGDNLKVRLRFDNTDITTSQKKSMRTELTAPLTAIGNAAKSIHPTHPWESDGAAALDAMSVEDGLGRLLGGSPSFVLAMAWLRFTLGNDNCAAISEQSYLGLLAAVSAARMGDDAPGMLGYWMSTETDRCVGGNDLLAEKIVRTIRDFRPKSVVDAIAIQPGRGPVTISSATRDAGNTVVRRNDDFDFAVLTVPPTVWNAITFTPPFDPAGRSIAQGPAVKFLSRYDSKFWKDDHLAPSAKWDKMGVVWDGTDNQPDKAAFDLTVFSGGPNVLPAADYPPRMKTLYPTGKPTGQQLIDWMAMPFIRTSYAIPAVGQVTTISPKQIEPHEQRLYFAGEQTSVGFFGYMEGALQSGARAARDIVVATARPCSDSAPSGYGRAFRIR